MRSVLYATTVAAIASLMRCPSGENPTPTPDEHYSYLAGFHHKEATLDCKSCHGENNNVDDSETEPNKACVKCHGTNDELVVSYPESRRSHGSHLGDIACTTCHRAHEPSKAICSSCHSSFALVPPYDGEPNPPASPPADAVPTSEESTDIVVVGSGGSGFSSAITAKELGARVIVLEKEPITGGNTLLASSGMNAAGTTHQAAKGLQDSPATMAADTLAGGANQGDPALVEIFANNSAGSLYWLESLGADMSDVGLLAGSSVARTHRPPGGAAVGKEIVRVLRRAAKDRSIDVRVNSRVVKILQEPDGRVSGVHVFGKHRGLYAIKAGALVLAAGGFAANLQKVVQLQPSYEGMTSSNQPGAMGDGIDLGQSVGALSVDMEKIQVHPTLAAGSKTLIAEGLRGNGGILVNREGVRFVNDIANRDVASSAILRQTGKTAFVVFDEDIRKSFAQVEGYFTLRIVKQGQTVPDLAIALGVPSAALQTTLDTYNGYQAAGVDSQFGRAQMPRAIKTAPFYAIEIAPGVHYTMGGLKFDAETHVISTAGAVVPGLYAAGEVTGGVHGNNRLGGNSTSETVTFGRIAGAKAAQFAIGPR